MTSSPPDAPATDPELAATVRLLHRRQGWSRMAATCFVVFLLAEGAAASAQSQGTPPPVWFQIVVIVPGALTLAGIVAAAMNTVLLRRIPADVRAQAGPAAAAHPSRPRVHHYPPRHSLPWALRWAGMLLVLVVAVVSLSGVIDGVAFLAGAGPTVTFDPTSYQTSCSQYGCQTSTDGILKTGGAGTSANWPGMVPLGQPFQVREPVWRWGLGHALISGDNIAVIAVVIGMLVEGFAIAVLVHAVRLGRSWRRHRQQTEPAAVSVS
jgi:hypothetical protein